MKLRPPPTTKESGTSSPAAKPVTKSLFDAWHELVAPDDIIEVGRRLGVIKRQRKIDLPALVAATIGAVSPVPGAETNALVNYLQLVGVGEDEAKIALSSFYDRYSEEFAALMRELALRAVARIRAAAPDDAATADFGVLLERFADVRLVDSTCHILKRLARDWAPSTSKKRPAGIKVHTVISLRDHLPVGDVSITPQRRHDNPAAPPQTFAPGVLALFDLGYIDVARFITMTEQGAFFVTRLKESHNPEIVRVHVGLGSKREARGMRLDEALGYVLHDDNGLIDVDVRIVTGDRSAVVRAVATVDSEGTRYWYLTNVARDVLSVPDVADTYRLRWEIELFFKQVKSGTGLSALLAWRASAVQAFVYSRIIALCLARLLELSVEERIGRHAAGHLAVVLVLIRALPYYLSNGILFGKPLTFEQMEERIIQTACIVAKIRNQRRARVKRNREQEIGAALEEVR
jgi:hypothetical protein